ncbi:hypothetical protein BBJ28_00021200 [Nothophytophthora sp. Chile5]|nr:hypothetical protein BBJ28_00021200 [Nothophytophthora sp. Chile5]
MKTYQPYGRVSSRDRERRAAGWDLRFAVLMVFPVICLVVVLYEFLYLQEYTSNEAQDAPVEERTYRGALVVDCLRRCSETLRSIFDNSVAPDNVKISIFDQIYEAEHERPCADIFCELVGEAECRRSQIVSSQIDAANATGPTAARYETEKGITDEDFCMTIDSHLVFIPKWDEKIAAQWDSLNNPMAIVSVYPKSTEHLTKHDVDDKVQLMCMSRIETKDKDSMVQYAAPMWIDKKDTPKPRLMSQLAGGFNFGGCTQAKEVRNDPYTPYLFHGEEYSRAARLWTSGYDFYVPSEDVAYHWYEKRKVVWERDWSERYVVQQASKRRIRYNLGLPVTAEDFDRTDLEKFALGTKRTFAQWQNFSGINPLAEFVGSEVSQFKNCGKLEYVPY